MPKVMVSIRVTKDRADWLKRVAEEMGCTQAQIVEMACRQWVIGQIPAAVSAGASAVVNGEGRAE